MSCWVSILVTRWAASWDRMSSLKYSDVGKILIGPETTKTQEVKVEPKGCQMRVRKDQIRFQNFISKMPRCYIPYPAPLLSEHHNWMTGLVFLTGLILDTPHTSWGTSTHSSEGLRCGTILVMTRQLFWGSRSHSSLGLLTIMALTWVSQT